MEKWIKELIPDMLPEPYCEYAELIGIDNLVKLSKLGGGDYMYIPTMDFLLRPVRDKHIKAAYNGYNRRQLAQKFALSEKRIREIVEGISPVYLRDENQLQLFSDEELR
ncbi:hypothetical protein J6TS7_21710 [Paenibacillus dendritiformis]|uniref:Mor transcription activator family protein n=1 Tax=Paenibacillus TaxID=44249 RepID=UPI001B14C6C0|nr:Mor transcription activator family protein [Paenibacillus dendritiformis]GIO78561.1 hypothetical protein J6TS7_21710 [Paenibacillus dendritiformis]